MGDSHPVRMVDFSAIKPTLTLDCRGINDGATAVKTFVLDADLYSTLTSVASFLPADGIEQRDALVRLVHAVRTEAVEDTGLHRFVRAINEAVASTPDSDGYAIVDMCHSLECSSMDPLVIATAVCALIGQPLRTITKSPLWKEATVSFGKDPNSFGGLGLLPLHIDHVNTTMPPDWTALLCLRPDPMGGGETILANLQRAANALSSEEVRVLQVPAFVEGKFFGLEGLGSELNPFPILTCEEDGLWQVRYTAKLLYNLADGPQREVLLHFTRLLEQKQKTLMLSAGQLLLMNQHIVAHGRLPLGPGQGDVPPGARRLCRQGHIRADSPAWSDA